MDHKWVMSSPDLYLSSEWKFIQFCQCDFLARKINGPCLQIYFGDKILAARIDTWLATSCYLFDICPRIHGRCKNIHKSYFNRTVPWIPNWRWLLKFWLKKQFTFSFSFNVFSLLRYQIIKIEFDIKKINLREGLHLGSTNHSESTTWSPRTVVRPAPPTSTLSRSKNKARTVRILPLKEICTRIISLVNWRGVYNHVCMPSIAMNHCVFCLIDHPYFSSVK